MPVEEQMRGQRGRDEEKRDAETKWGRVIGIK
jgi:hypothetical protein